MGKTHSQGDWCGGCSRWFPDRELVGRSNILGCRYCVKCWGFWQNENHQVKYEKERRSIPGCETNTYDDPRYRVDVPLPKRR